ncbi:MAG TPA: hypothetical protein V6C69_22110 [Trichormus sp.]|jgi:tetratricopeptide (TPR) repeat protein
MDTIIPDELPDNLEPSQYYSLGLRYRLGGRIGLAGEALRKVVELAPGSAIAFKSDLILRTQLPRAPVPEAAENRNIEAYNLMGSDPEAAKQKFQKLMAEFPDFEWPFSNLAYMYLSEGKVKEAKELVTYLLAVNPEHLRSNSIAIKIAIEEKDFTRALELADRTKKLCQGSDEGLRQEALMIKIRLKGPPPDTLAEGLTADEYFELAETYAILAKLELCRRALELTLSLEPNKELTSKATRMLKCNLPRQPISAELDRRLNEMRNLAREKSDELKTCLEQLATDFPDAEIVLQTLAHYYFTQQDMTKSERFAKLALRCHPDFSPPKELLVLLYMLQQKYDSALEIVAKEAKLADATDMTYDLLRAECELARYQSGL